mmetsp:Transcript_80761/g.142450  ORF Transcript_80761/g.142450 Transcript_80761/m.142450 type:complete len:99 (+) Transcript_80761:22-318(+)
MMMSFSYAQTVGSNLHSQPRVGELVQHVIVGSSHLLGAKKDNHESEHVLDVQVSQGWLLRLQHDEDACAWETTLPLSMMSQVILYEPPLGQTAAFQSP